MTGQLFHKYKFAFAVNRNHMELADRISVALIALHESGELSNLHARYFGRSDMRVGTGINVPPPVNITL